MTNTGGVSSSNEFSVYKVKLLPNTNYVLTNSGKTSAPSICFYDKNNHFIEGIKYNNHANVSFTTKSNTDYALVSVVTLSTAARYDLDIFQIEIGSSATTYDSYFNQTLNINLNDLELCKIGNYQDYFYKENNK